MKRKYQYGSSNIKWVWEENQSDGCAQIRQERRQTRKVVKNLQTRSYITRYVQVMQQRGKESTCQCRKCKNCRFEPWVRKFLWSRKRHPTLVFLPVKFHGQRSTADYVHGATKSRMRLSLSTSISTYTIPTPSISIIEICISLAHLLQLTNKIGCSLIHYY